MALLEFLEDESSTKEDAKFFHSISPLSGTKEARGFSASQHPIEDIQQPATALDLGRESGGIM